MLMVRMRRAIMTTMPGTSNPITNLPSSDLVTEGSNTADEFMAWNKWAGKINSQWMYNTYKE